MVYLVTEANKTTKIDAENVEIKGDYFYFYRNYQERDGVLVAIFFKPISVVVDDPLVVK